MKRTIMSCLMALIVGILCGMFIYLDLSIDMILAVANSTNPFIEIQALAANLFEGSITPVSSFAVGRFAPVAVLGIAGFISGLVAKDANRALVACIVFLAVFFMGFVVFTGAALEFESIKILAQNMTWDLAISFFILFISSMIGAALTEDELVGGF